MTLKYTLNRIIQGQKEGRCTLSTFHELPIQLDSFVSTVIQEKWHCHHPWPVYTAGVGEGVTRVLVETGWEKCEGQSSNQSNLDWEDSKNVTVSDCQSSAKSIPSWVLCLPFYHTVFASFPQEKWPKNVEICPLLVYIHFWWLSHYNGMYRKSRHFPGHCLFLGWLSHETVSILASFSFPPIYLMFSVCCIWILS